MFSYRHAFHAGNHADVLKHMMLIALLRHMTQKESALHVIDTHAGAGLYRLDGDLSEKGAEAADGIFKLALAASGSGPDAQALAPMLRDYLDQVQAFNSGRELKIYPGSPFIAHRLLRNEARDKLKLFELHPTDAKALAGNVAQLKAGRQISVTRQDGFEGLKSLLPPPSRRALILIDPSYEIKSDYAKVSACIQNSIKRFATGTYMVWYPIIPRAEAHDLPRRLKSIALASGRAWLHVTLNIGQQGATEIRVRMPGERIHGQGLSASGVFLLNPPHTLKSQLGESLPQLLTVLGRGAGRGFSIDAG